MIEDIAQALGPVDVRARRRDGVPRDGRVRRARGAGRDGRDRRRRDRRPGRDRSCCPLIGIVWVCAVLGDTTSFFIGRRLGRGFLEQHGPRVKITARAARAGRGLLRPPRRQDDPDRPLHRPRARARAVHRRLVGARLPALHPVQHRRHRPLGDDLLRARLRLLALVRQGGAHRRPGDLRLRRDGGGDRRRWWWPTGAGARSASWLERARAPPARAAAVRGRPAGAPRAGAAGRARSPPRRCASSWTALTPGELGLELTTALAVAGVGLYVFVALRDRARRRPGRTPLDTRAARPGRPACATTARRRREGRHRPRLVPDASPRWSWPRVVLLVVRRRPPRLLVLVRRASRSSTWRCTLAKAAVDRPRPAGRSSTPSGSSYPSGHAAYSTTWVAVAVVAHAAAAAVASRRRSCSPRWRSSRRSGCRASTCARTTGRTSLGGWGLGAGSSALLAAIALVVAHIRHNGPARADARSRRARAMNLDLTTPRSRSPWPRALVVACYVGLILVPAGAATAALGEARGELPDALHPRDAARHRRRDRAGDRLDLRHAYA